MKKLAKSVCIAVLVMLCAFAGAACSQKEEKPTVEIYAVGNITSVYAGETVQFRAKVTPASDYAVEWFVSGAEGCRISEKGLFTAGEVAGKATVTAKVKGTDVTASCEITIKAGTDLTLEGSLADVTVAYGDELEDNLLSGAVVKDGDKVVGGRFSFVNSTEVLNVGAHDVDVVFKADESCYNDLSTTVKVNVVKRDITVKALNRNMEWGGEEPSFVYSVIEGSLVNGDEPTGNLAREEGNDVGVYEISIGTLDFGGNYNVNFIPGDFEIRKATAKITFENVAVTYNGEMQAPKISISPKVDYEITFNGDAVNGVTAAGVYEVIVKVENSNISGTAKEVFKINKLNVLVSAENLEQDYSADGNQVKIVTEPKVDDLIVTYKNATYDSTEAPREAGKYQVIVSQPEFNYNLNVTSFSYTLHETGYFSEEVKLFAREMGTTPIYDLSEVGTAITGVSVSGKRLAASEYRVIGNELILAGSAFSNSVGTNACISLYVNDGLYIADVYVTDYIIDETNWREFLINKGEHSLATTNPTVLSKAYILTTDIIYGADDYFLGIGRGASNGGTATFTGYFDGNGHVIKNWTAREKINDKVIDTMTMGNSGFIGVLSGTLCNLGLENITVKVGGSSAKGHFFAGGFVGGLPGGKIINCYIDGAYIQAYRNTTTDEGVENSSVGAIFAVTGNAPQENPSVIKNVFVYGDVTLVTRQASWIRGIGQASRSTGRFLSVENVYVTKDLKCYTRDDETLLALPTLVDGLSQVTQNNVEYKAADEFKVAKTSDNLYAAIEGPWVFADGQNPVLSEVYSSTVGGEVVVDGLQITNTETEIEAGKGLQIKFKYDFSNGLATPVFMLTSETAGVKISETGYITTDLSVPNNTVIGVKVKVSNTESEEYRVTVRTPRMVIVNKPASEITIPQGGSEVVELKLTETVAPDSAIDVKFQIFNGEDFEAVEAIDGVSVTDKKISVAERVAIDTKFKVSFVATDAAGSVASAWITVTVTESLNTEVVTKSYYAKDQTGYNSAVFKLPQGSTISSVAYVGEGSNVVLDETKYSVDGRIITLAASYVDTLANGDHAFVVALDGADSVTITLKKGDVIIGADNWKDYLMNPLGSVGKLSLAKNDKTVLGKYYILATDINYGETEYFLGVGRPSVNGGSGTFTGYFDGDGHVIYNWKAGKNATESVINGGNTAFFGVHAGTVCNLGFDNVTIHAHGKTALSFVGVIAGALPGGKIYDCFIHDATIISISDLADDKSSAGFVFASTGTAPESNPSVVQNVLVFGELKMTVGKAGMQRAIGTASSTSNRFLNVTNVYVSDSMQAFWKDGNPITTSTLLVDNRTQVKQENVLYKADGEFKVGNSDGGIYSGFTKDFWHFADGEYPCFTE